MQSGWVEIFFLAMLAGFIGLRLYHVLGRKTGDENGAGPYQPSQKEYRAPASVPDIANEGPVVVHVPSYIAPAVRPGIEDIMRSDRQFQPDHFLTGAQSAYAMILEAFWKGDLAALRDLASDEILDNFQVAIQARHDAGERLENRLLQVDRAEIVAAHVNGNMAEVTVRFDAEIVTATRDAEGRVIAGDPARSIQTHDLWTFSHHMTSSDPSWLLIATDEVV